MHPLFNLVSVSILNSTILFDLDKINVWEQRRECKCKLLTSRIGVGGCSVFHVNKWGDSILSIWPIRNLETVVSIMKIKQKGWYKCNTFASQLSMEISFISFMWLVSFWGCQSICLLQINLHHITKWPTRIENACNF